MSARKQGFVVAVAWQEREPGVCAYGPYATREEAELDVGRLLTEYHDVPANERDGAELELGLVVDIQELMK